MLIYQINEPLKQFPEFLLFHFFRSNRINLCVLIWFKFYFYFNKSIETQRLMRLDLPSLTYTTLHFLLLWYRRRHNYPRN